MQQARSPAEERERRADERDQAADERERLADERERLADEREQVADRREERLDTLANQLTEVQRRLPADSDARIQQTLTRIADGREALERSRARLDRSEATFREGIRRAGREQAEIEREACRSTRDLDHRS